MAPGSEDLVRVERFRDLRGIRGSVFAEEMLG